MMREVDEQKKLKMDQQKIIDDAIKAGPYFNSPRQLKEAQEVPEAPPTIDVTAREVIEVPPLESKMTLTFDDGCGMPMFHQTQLPLSAKEPRQMTDTSLCGSQQNFDFFDQKSLQQKSSD